MTLRRIAAVCLSLSTSLAQIPTLQTGTQIVLIDVTVTDSHGAPVPNLKASDFSLLEDGSPQTIAHFEEHTPGAPSSIPLPKLEPNTYTDFTLASPDGPNDILLIDTLNTPISDQAGARQQLIALVKRLPPDTRLAIFSLSTRLTLLQPFTSDPRLLLAAVSNNTNVQGSPLLSDPLEPNSIANTVRVPSAEIMATLAQGEATNATERTSIRVRTTLEAMNQLARYLSGVPGRKNLLWLSGSFPLNLLPDTSVRNSSVTTGDFETSLHDTVNLLTRSQVAIYPIHNDVTADKDLFSPQHFDDPNTMQRLAESTGGRSYRNTTNIAASVQKAIDDGSHYYTLSYRPTRKETSGYRRITIRLPSGDDHLGYRSGYYVDPPRPSGGDHPPAPAADPMRIAMQRGAPTPTQILFKSIVVTDGKTVRKPAEGNVVSPHSKPPFRIATIAYAADPGDILMPAGTDGLRHVKLDFVALVYDRDGQLFTQQVNHVDVFAGAQAFQNFLKEGVRYQQQIAVPEKGEYFLRAGIHDLLGDAIGAIEVPASSIQTASAESH
jgi:VWFA-related protein